jgi:hypothetical protein
MADHDYGRISVEGIRLDDRSNRRMSTSSGSSGSDIVYRDNLDADPFEDEKDARFQDEPTMEQGDDGQGYVAESRRVGFVDHRADW